MALPALSTAWFGLFKLSTLALLWHQGFLFPSKNLLAFAQETITIGAMYTLQMAGFAA